MKRQRESISTSMSSGAQRAPSPQTSSNLGPLSSSLADSPSFVPSRQASDHLEDRHAFSTSHLSTMGRMATEALEQQGSRPWQPRLQKPGRGPSLPRKASSISLDPSAAPSVQNRTTKYHAAVLGHLNRVGHSPPSSMHSLSMPLMYPSRSIHKSATPCCAVPRRTSLVAQDRVQVGSCLH